ncbi:hypothetical protein HA402_008599 [Bradysia odoriphaga]|nr:hypothetical protein HA402_008599 [Bradysia odoriphaga]
MEPEPDPDRNLKRIGMSLGVATRIKKLFRNRPKIKQRTPEEIEEELLANAKQNRDNRIAGFGPIQRHIFGLVAKHYNISVDDIVQGVADSDEGTDILNSFCTKNGHSVIVFLYAKFKCPGKGNENKWSSGVPESMSRTLLTETGRYEPNQENQEMMRVEISVEELNVEESETLKVAIDRLISELNLLPNPRLRKEKVESGSDEKEVLRIEYQLDNLTDFEVSHKLFKGHLLVPHQIKATSRNRDLVDEVKKYFDRWLQRIAIVLLQDKQIVKDSNDVGPLHELKYWQKRLERYRVISDFLKSRPFINHLTCLEYTRAKLLKKWKAIETEFNALVLETENNVETLQWLQPFWDPLYTGTPSENCEPIHRLVSALRDVYNDSKNYNTPERVTSFLVKTTNQLVILCRSHLNERGTLKVLQQKPSFTIEKFSDCHKLLKKYENSYFEVINSMEMGNTTPWTCSITYIFGISNKFQDRIAKVIGHIIDTKVTYSVLDKIKISGMERYRNQIVSEFNEITEKPYFHTNHWVKQFDSDYIKWNKATEAAEIGMQKFVKQSMAPIQNTSAMLLLLKRFEKLQLNCLCLDRRYLDVAVMLEKEMEEIKDAYNELRDNPPLMKGTPPVYGRILWIRGLQKRIDEVMNAIKGKPCVVKHQKAQIAVKCYNYMTDMFLKYEEQQHKAWFDFSEAARTRLGQCVIRRNPNTHMLEVNFHASIYELIRESEGMLKLGLDIPSLAQTVCFYRDVLLNAVETLKQLIKRNNDLRSSVDNVFIRISRPIFRKLDDVFKEGLKTVQWDSKDLAEYFTEVDKVIHEVADFFTAISETKRRKIDASLHYISNAELVIIPDEPVPIENLYNLNNDYRSKIDKKIEEKSAMAELGTVEIINRFVQMIEVSDTDANGETLLQLPVSSQTDANYREELRKPIDKYDWLSFPKINRQVFFPESERFNHLFKVSKDSFTYGLVDLHSDCMDVFSYFFGKCVDAMATSSRLSLEILKKKMLTNEFGFLVLVEPQFFMQIFSFTVLQLHCPIWSSMYQNTLKNIVETFGGVSSWGKLAQTEERKKRKKLVEEVNRERSFFKYIWEHKQVERTMQTQSLSLGMILLQPDMKELVNKMYQKYSHLWADDKIKIIEDFVKSNPLTVNIRDKFIFYDLETNEIINAEKRIVVGAILVNAEPAFDSFLQLSKERKAEVGRRLSEACNKKVSSMVDFINEQQVVLTRNLKDLDDVRLAMNCLDAIKD